MVSVDPSVQNLGFSRRSLGPWGRIPILCLSISLEFSTAAASAPRHPSLGKIPGSLRLAILNHTSFPPPALRPNPQSGPHPTLTPVVPVTEMGGQALTEGRERVPGALQSGEKGQCRGRSPRGAGVGGVALLKSPYKAGQAVRLLDWLIQMSIPPGNRVSIGSQEK